MTTLLEPAPQNVEPTVVLQTARGPIDVDASVAPIVEALNAIGVETIASCSGHGHRPGNIALRDGRELIIARNFDEARQIDRLFPVASSGERVAEAGQAAEGMAEVRQRIKMAIIANVSTGEGRHFEIEAATDRILTTLARPAGEHSAEAFHAQQIAEAMDEGDGFWKPCSGCQESVDGYVSAKEYPFNPVFRCQPGGGCSECGGLGVLWDDTDYGAMADAMVADMEAEDAQVPERGGKACEACGHALDDEYLTQRALQRDAETYGGGE